MILLAGAGSRHGRDISPVSSVHFLSPEYDPGQ